jgi:hypothetical protein
VSVSSPYGQFFAKSSRPFRSSAGVALLSLAAATATAQSDFTRVIVPAGQTLPEKTATAVLVEETASRVAPSGAPRVETGPITPLAPGEDPVLLAERPAVEALLPPELLPAWRAALRGLHPTAQPEAFTVITLPWRSGHVTVVAGNDARGELFGAGWLLRNMRFKTAKNAQIPLQNALFSAPDKAIRGQQIGYRAKNNTYDAWDLPQFERHIRELAIFGNNTIQLISPNSDDAASSPLFHRPAFETVVGISQIVDKYGLICDLYYPEMRPDYTQPAAVAAELKDFETLVRAMPRIDSIHIPGGDPGHTPPEILFPLVEKETQILHRYHPGAKVWVSAQGFDKERFTAFYKLLDRHPAWLTGVFFGPQSHDSFPTERALIPARYEMQFYPDIAHTMHAEFPIPQWDPIFALTEGREPICPRPQAFSTIYKRFAPLNTGFITYSEGVNDHVNQIVFDSLGWNPDTPTGTILAEYARFFLHREGHEQALAVQAIQGLEEDWDGPLLANTQISRTVALLDQLRPDPAPNGEWESLLYRATYDRYVQVKRARELREEDRALTALGNADAEAARQALASEAPSSEEQQAHDRLFALADKLFHDWGLQLSVPRYGGANWERGANLDRVDTPLNDAAWLRNAIDKAGAMPEKVEQTAALQAIAHWGHPVPGALYDDLGDPANEPHLVREAGWQEDPELYRTAIDGIADRTLQANPSADPFAPAEPAHPADPWRLSWITYAETLYETPLQLRYTGLDEYVSWKVRVTYAGEDYALPLSLTANSNVVIHPARLRHSNPETVEFPIPPSATADGSLTLTWQGPSGSPGSGRGRQVAEVWLIPTVNPVH